MIGRDFRAWIYSLQGLVFVVVVIIVVVAISPCNSRWHNMVPIDKEERIYMRYSMDLIGKAIIQEALPADR